MAELGLWFRAVVVYSLSSNSSTRVLYSQITDSRLCAVPRNCRHLCFDLSSASAAITTVNRIETPKTIWTSSQPRKHPNLPSSHPMLYRNSPFSATNAGLG